MSADDTEILEELIERFLKREIGAIKVSGGGYRGGSTIIGYGGRWITPDDAEVRRRGRHGEGGKFIRKENDAEMEAIMAEHDALRAQGVDPVAHLRKRRKKK